MSTLCFNVRALALQVKPLLQATRMDEVIATKDDEIKKVKEVADKTSSELEELRKTHTVVVTERQALLADLTKERDHTAELDEERRLLANNKKNLEEYSHDLENRIGEEEEHLKKLVDENKKLQQNFQDLEDQYARHPRSISLYLFDGVLYCIVHRNILNCSN